MGSRSRRKPPRPAAVTISTPSPPATTATATIRRPPQPQLEVPKRPRPVDTSSRAYKAAVWKYTGFMIAMPILLVTSYVLFDRLALGNKAKSLTPTPVPAMEDRERKEG
ncbi:hypothetical protein F5X96DRAFT_667234 [Biscogniauxia mediterranea]|nr:hypothetical protein F5X96DRAFT_667234 [Biscogniauxia mediterranea]